MKEIWVGLGSRSHLSLYFFTTGVFDEWVIEWVIFHCIASSLWSCDQNKLCLQAQHTVITEPFSKHGLSYLAVTNQEM